MTSFSTAILLCVVVLNAAMIRAEKTAGLEEIINPDMEFFNPEGSGPPENQDQLPVSEMSPLVEPELQRLSNILVDILQQSWGPSGVPILYVEKVPTDLQVPAEGQELAGAAWKRSRYYRRYPWKRQNSRSRTRYEVDNRYMCQPSKEDVFKLLVALHETRAGNGGKSINFCNRRRSAGAIFTNIRFLGRK